MNDAERQRYRERLLDLRARLAEEAQEAVNAVIEKIQASNELSHLPTHSADRDMEGLDSDIALETNREQRIGAIDESLRRIREGNYGLCEKCGCEIPKTRLNALPFAVRCVACEEKAEVEVKPEAE